MTEEVKALSASEQKKEDWMNTKWRPAMGWMYMATCVFDFILFPILWAIIQFWETQASNDAFRQWQPLTLQGAGLFHMAMGAVLGIAAWSRGQEKIAGAAGGPTPSFGSPSMPSSFGSPSPSPSFGARPTQPPTFGSPTGGQFGSPSGSLDDDDTGNIPPIKPIIRRPQ